MRNESFSIRKLELRHTSSHLHEKASKVARDQESPLQQHIVSKQATAAVSNVSLSLSTICSGGFH